jgi:hypothetical protein
LCCSGRCTNVGDNRCYCIPSNSFCLNSLSCCSGTCRRGQCT